MWNQLLLQKQHIPREVLDIVEEDPAILKKQLEEKAKAERIRKEAEEMDRIRKEAEAKARERELAEVTLMARKLFLTSSDFCCLSITFATVWTQSRSNRTSLLIWVQTI